MRIMNRREREQFRLDTRAEAMEDALGEARFGERTGRTALEALEQAARIARQRADEGPDE